VCRAKIEVTRVNPSVLPTIKVPRNQKLTI
jgi:hypothetical protein